MWQQSPWQPSLMLLLYAAAHMYGAHGICLHLHAVLMICLVVQHVLRRWAVCSSLSSVSEVNAAVRLCVTRSSSACQHHGCHLCGQQTRCDNSSQSPKQLLHVKRLLCFIQFVILSFFFIGLTLNTTYVTAGASKPAGAAHAAAAVPAPVVRRAVEAGRCRGCRQGRAVVGLSCAALGDCCRAACRYAFHRTGVAGACFQCIFMQLALWRVADVPVWTHKL